MPRTQAIVLVIDRLGAGWIGPYGNTWLETPNFNRLAAESVLFETVICVSPDLSDFARSSWYLRRADELAKSALTSQLASAGGRSVLFTDESAVAGHPLASSFSERTSLPPSNAIESADSIEQTQLYRFFEAARSLLLDDSPADLYWLHSCGMAGPWDAPLELRYQFADDEDPTPPSLVVPPSEVLGADVDPDLLLGYAQAYAGQVALADMCLGMLLDALAEHPRGEQTLLIVTSPRSYPLGEHGRVGKAQPALYGELLHVPLLVRAPGLAPARVQGIVQPTLIPALVAAAREQNLTPDDLGVWLEAVPESGRNLAYATSPGERAIRTPAWFLRELPGEGGEPAYELFAKPDDRWEANEISSRCGEAVELLAAELARLGTPGAAQWLAETAPLPELLCDIWR